MNKTRIFGILLLLTGTNAMAQNITMEGTILDSETNLPVEFVNIGVPERNTGTVSNLDGKFKLVVPATFSKESLIISHINYFPEEVPVASSEAGTIFLRPRTNELTEVVLSNEKKNKRNRKVGIKNYNPLLWVGTASEGNDIIENAQLIKIPNKTVLIKYVNLYLRNGFEKDSTHIRINFYSNKDNAPGEKIVFQNLVQKKQIEPGWLKIDLTQHHIQLEEDFFVGVEFIPDFQNKMEVYLGAKLTKGKGFSRTSSQGQWNKLQGASTINVEIEY